MHDNLNCMGRGSVLCGIIGENSGMQQCTCKLSERWRDHLLVRHRIEDLYRQRNSVQVVDKNKLPCVGNVLLREEESVLRVVMNRKIKMEGIYPEEDSCYWRLDASVSHVKGDMAVVKARLHSAMTRTGCLAGALHVYELWTYPDTKHSNDPRVVKALIM